MLFFCAHEKTNTPKINAKKLGTKATVIGGQVFNSPRCENKLFPRWKVIPTIIPINILKPIEPFRECIYAAGKAINIIIHNNNG